MKWIRWTVAAGLAAVSPVHAAPPGVTHGVMAAEVTASEVVIWSHTDQPARMTVTLRAGDLRSESARPVTAATDFTGQVRFGDLQPATAYTYRVRFDNAAAERGPAVDGSFRTAPQASA